MVRVRRGGGLFLGENFAPCAYPSFPERGEVCEEFVGIMDGLALLSDHFVVLFCAHCTLDGLSFLHSCVVCGL